MNEKYQLPELSDHQSKVQRKDTSDGESNGTEDRDFHSSESDISEAEFQGGSENGSRFVEEQKISKVLSGWMTDYVLKTIEPYEPKEKEPLYSTKLGLEPTIKRTQSSESIITELSLLSCSTYGKKLKVRKKSKRKKRTEHSPTETGTTASKWLLALQSRKHGTFDKMMRQNSTLAHVNSPGFVLGTSGNLAMDLMDDDERQQVLRCSQETWIKMKPGLKKSDSSTNINKALTTRRRFSEMNVKGLKGKPLNIHVNDLLEPVNDWENRKNSLKNDFKGISVDMLDKQTNRTVTPPFKEKVRMWHVDDRTLNVDINRGMSTKVKERIASTTMALERASRQNTTRPNTSTGCIRRDPNNPQNIRISPELGDVIKQDIKVRMGRPRYHEIKEKDIEIWNRGYSLDRSHRNLKVFNWLQSLKEDEFDADNSIFGDEYDCHKTSVIHVHVDSVDEPKLKPTV